MSLPYAKPTWIDAPVSGPGSYQVAMPTGLPIFSSPIPLSTTPYLLNQDFIQFKNNFAPLPLGTPHVDYPTYYLVKEGELRDQLGGVVRWTRTYAQVPASYNLWETVPYNFIGTLISIGSPATNITRTRELWPVDARVQYDYFLVPSTAVADPITGSTHDLNEPGDIDQIQQMIYVFQNTIGGALYGGITMTADILNPAGSSVPTWPPSTQAQGTPGIASYEAMVSDALQNEWNSTVTQVFLNPTNTLSGGPPPNAGHMAGTVILAPFAPSSILGGQLPAEPSRLDLWLGSIWVRRTKYVLAK